MGFIKNIFKNKSKILDTIGCFVFAIIFFSIVFAILFFFGSTLLTILGFEYDSLATLINFFMVYAILDFFIDLIIGAFAKLFYIQNIVDTTGRDILYVFLDIVTTITLLGVLEFAFDGIEISFLTAVLYALISCIGGYFLDKKLDDLNDDSEKECDNLNDINN